MCERECEKEKERDMERLRETWRLTQSNVLPILLAEESDDGGTRPRPSHS